MVYLGHMVSDDGRSDIEIKRIEIARNTYIIMLKMLTSRDISIEKRKRLVKCYISSTILHGKYQIVLGKINALEMWIYKECSVYHGQPIK